MKHTRNLMLILMLTIVTSVLASNDDDNKIADIRQAYDAMKQLIERGVSMENLLYCTTITNCSTVPAIGWVTRTINIYSIPPDEDIDGDAAIPGTAEYHNIILFITVSDEANGIQRTYDEYLFDRKSGQPAFVYSHESYPDEPVKECRYYYEKGRLLHCMPEMAKINKKGVLRVAKQWKSMADEINLM